jgi:hypothetical protein
MNWTSLKSRLADRWFGDAIAAKVQQAVLEQTVRQALPMSPAYFGQDPSLSGFRRLSGNDQSRQAAYRDLPLMTHERMQQVAYFLYLTNPMAQWQINMMKDYVIGEGVTLKAKDEQTQAVVESWWKDPVNNWPIKLENKVRELSLYGEQCWPVFIAEGTGRVRLGYLDPFLIQDVILDPDNAEQAIGVVTKSRVTGIDMPERRFKTILAITDDELTPMAQRERARFTDGECFYFSVNKVSNASRGWSDLLAKADWLDGYEQFLFQRLERSDLANRIVFDLTLQGFTQEQINAFMKTFALPRPGGVHAHNEKVTLNPVAPDLKAHDASVDARLFKHQCLAGMPEHWFGGGGDVNRATAGEMDEPTFKMLGSRQRLWKGILEEGVGFAIRQAKAAAALPQSADETVQAIFPEMVAADLTKLGDMLGQVATAVATMVTQQIVTKMEARQLFATASKSFGVELNDLNEDELAAAFAEDTFRDAAQDYLTPAKPRPGSSTVEPETRGPEPGTPGAV